MQDVDTEVTTSPTPSKVKVQVTMGFGEAMEQVLSGKKVTRLEWEDLEAYLVIRAEVLHIHKEDGTWHTLQVGTGDLTGKDWIAL